MAILYISLLAEMEVEKTQLFFELLQIALGNRKSLSRGLSSGEWEYIYNLSKEQAILGVMLKGIQHLPQSQLPPKLLLLQWVGETNLIQQQNEIMDKAVVRLCRVMGEEGIRIFVFKGQTVAALYDDHSLRQSGDIDFYCYSEDWEKAVRYFKEKVGLKLNDLNSQKDVCFTWDGVIYEMHNQITEFNYPIHSRYWKRVVMPEILVHPYSVKVGGADVPTLAPTYNALFIFIHIFQHLIADGIALRQFCDWACVLTVQHDEIDVDILQRHLKELGLLKAYFGLGAVLTEILGLDPALFPFEISDNDRERLPALWQNMLERGNFAHNVSYKTKNMFAHGLEHIWRMSKQAREFYHYAPAEAWWHIPHIFSWWPIKIGRILKKSMRK